MGCIDPLMEAYHAILKYGIKLHDKVLVIGTGIIGHFIGNLVRKSEGSLVAASKVNDLKLHKAKKHKVFDEYLNGNDLKFAEKAKDISKDGFNITFEVVGTGTTLDQCVDELRPGGKVVMIGNSIEPKVPFI